MTTETASLGVTQLGVWSFDRFYNFLMTLATRLFSYIAATLSDVDVVWIPTSREVIGMPETVLRFGCIFRDETGRRVTVVADRNSAMARLHPRAVLVLHYVTVETCISIVAHVGVSTRVDKSVRADPHNEAERNAQDKPLCQARVHRTNLSAGGIRRIGT